MSDFSKIAQEAKRASDARSAEREARELAQLQENQRLFDTHVAALSSLVGSLIEEAAEACKQSGVTAQIQTNFKTPANRYQVAPARIEFSCSGHGRLIAGVGYEAPESDIASFEFGTDGGYMRYGNSRERLEWTNDPRGAVATALERVLQSYFQSVERIGALSRS